jgi:hypothetical protein
MDQQSTNLRNALSKMVVTVHELNDAARRLASRRGDYGSGKVRELVDEMEKLIEEVKEAVDGTEAEIREDDAREGKALHQWQGSGGASQEQATVAD